MVLNCFCLTPDSKLPTESQNRHRSHRQSGQQRHTLTPQHFYGKSKPSCWPDGGRGRAMTCRYLDQSRCLFHLVCCCGCWEQTRCCVTGFLLSDPSPEHELNDRQQCEHKLTRYSSSVAPAVLLQNCFRGANSKLLPTP